MTDLLLRPGCRRARVVERLRFDGEVSSWKQPEGCPPGNAQDARGESCVAPTPAPSSPPARQIVKAVIDTIDARRRASCEWFRSRARAGDDPHGQAAVSSVAAISSYQCNGAGASRAEENRINHPGRPLQVADRTRREARRERIKPLDERWRDKGYLPFRHRAVRHTVKLAARLGNRWYIVELGGDR